MNVFLKSRSIFLVALLFIIVASIFLVDHLFIVGSQTANQLQVSVVTPTPTLPFSTISQPGTTSTPAPAFCRLKGRNFQMGIAFPQWSPDGYGGSNNQWLSELPQMRAQTSACWVEMPILFSQATLNSTVITTGQSTPSLAALRYGIQFAHAQGLHVFVTVLLQISGSQPWAGSIKFATYAQEQAWFQGYWKAIQPYVQVAQQAGAEQLAIGTEEEWLQEYAPDTLWNTLIANIHGTFSGELTYDMNWTSLAVTPRTWMRNPALKMIGVSAYLPLVTGAERVDPQQIPHLWATMVKQKLDAFARELGEPIFISEIGYRDSSDALYQPWVTTSSAPTDPAEQAAACSAVLTNVLGDSHILGSFFWGWDNAEAFNLKGSQAATAIQTHYQALQA